MPAQVKGLAVGIRGSQVEHRPTEFQGFDHRGTEDVLDDVGLTRSPKKVPHGWQ